MDAEGVVLQSNVDGSPKAWSTAVANTVSMVDFVSPAEMVVSRTLELDDPTDPQVKLGRAVNRANASSTVPSPA